MYHSPQGASRLNEKNEVARAPADRAHGRERLRPNRLTIAAAALAGWFIGVLPYLTFVSRRNSFGVLPAVVLVALAAIIAFASQKPNETEATDRPSRGEWLLAICASTGSVFIALSALAFYGLGYWATRLWNFVVDLLGWDAAAQPEPIAVWTSVAIAFFLGLGAVGMAVERLTRTLYPTTAGTRSIYYPLLRQRYKLIAFAAGVAVAVALAAFGPGNWQTTLAAGIILVYVAMPLDDLEKDVRPRALGLTDEVVRVLESTGYAIVRLPRTGDPMIDPLIQNVTLLASAGEAGFAIEVTERAPDVPVEWSVASGIRTAAAVLQQQMVVDGRHLRSVRPVLIVAGGTISAGLQRFSEVEGVRLVHLPRADDPDDGARLLESFHAIGIGAGATGGEVHA